MPKKLPKVSRKTQTSKSDVPVGKISGPFGIRGELKCDPSSAGRIVFSAGVKLRCTTRTGEASEVVMTQVRPHKGRLLITIAGVEDADAAKALNGAILHAPRDWIELEPGEYLDEDLVGCNVYGIDGTDYGAVEAVEHYPASDMLIVRGGMVPMVAACVRSIDLGQSRIVIDPPAGLFD